MRRDAPHRQHWGVVEIMVNASGLSVAVVGCGYWGSKHVRVLHSTDGVGQVVLVDERESRLEQLARIYPGAPRFTSLRAALADIDAAVIATPPTTHVPAALEAIEAGKHVLVEKPLAPSSAGARRLIQAADTAGVTLMAGHTFEYNPAVWKLRELIHGQSLGEIYYLDSARLNLGLYQSDVNVILDLAPHDVSIINYVLGDTPRKVQAWASRHAHPRFEDVAYLRLFYDDQRLSANVHVSWLDPCKVRRITAVGSEKMAVYDDLAADEPIRVLDRGVQPPSPMEDFTQPPMSYRYGDITAPFVAPEEPLGVQDRHFVECIISGAVPNTDGACGLAVVEVLECAQMSLELGRPVELEELATDHRTRIEARTLHVVGPRPWLRDHLSAAWDGAAYREQPQTQAAGAGV
jgi:predicted dehydrogenase